MFGDVAMYRGHCPTCDETSLSPVPGQCDKGHALATPRRQFRESVGSFSRAKPTKARQLRLLAEQEYRCYWCLRHFGTTIEFHGQVKQLRVEWDHFTPFSYSGSCGDDAFVAACQVCNGIKGSHVFDSVEEARLYIVGELAGSVEIAEVSEK